MERGPVDMTKPCDLSAVEARRLIGRKILSPVELLESCINRIEAINPSLNAFVATCYERARSEAKAAEDAVMGGKELGPLHGLPVGIKDIEETEGLRTTYGSLLLKDYVPKNDEGIVKKLRKAGAIILGKTNTSEFAAGAITNNAVYGPTRNPFDLKLTPGGSSGGSAVAVATNMVPIATGTDAGGSLRNPASFSGVVGFRPTPGLVPSDKRLIGNTTFYVPGPMARTVEDAALLLSGTACDDPMDPLAGPVDTGSFYALPPVDLSRLRVAISEDLGFAPVDDGIRATFRDRVDQFRSAFKTCDEQDPDLANADDIFWIWRGIHFVAAHKERCEKDPDKIGDMIKKNVALALELTMEDVAWCKAEETRLYRRFQRFFDDVDILIAPATSVPPFPVEEPYCSQINGQQLERNVSWLAITYGITLTAHPAIAIPCGKDHTGMPFGIQIVGRRRADAFVLGVANKLERLFATKLKLARPVPRLSS